MPSFFRSLLVATALLSSGVLQVAATFGEDACCAEDERAPCPDCPVGVACACCPFQGAVPVAAPELAPAASPGAAVAIASAEPSPRTSVADIFHPPRA